MEIERVTISMRSELAALLAQRAKEQSRSVSNYASMVIEADLRALGLIPVERAAVSTEALAEIQQALLDQPDILPAIKKLIRSRRRSAKGPVAA